MLFHSEDVFTIMVSIGDACIGGPAKTRGTDAIPCQQYERILR
jgi:hypothetical protein